MNISLKSGLLSMLCGALAIVATAGIALGWPIGLIDARNVGDPYDKGALQQIARALLRQAARSIQSTVSP